MCLSLASPPQLILARLAIQTTPSKKVRTRDNVECTAEYQQNGCPGLDTFQLSRRPRSRYSRVLGCRQKRLLGGIATETASSQALRRAAAETGHCLHELIV